MSERIVMRGWRIRHYCRTDGGGTMDKPRIIFPFAEAGLGHIMPLKSIADAFEKKYGDVTQCVRTSFFGDSDDRHLRAFGKFIGEEVVKQNRHTFYGFLSTFVMTLFGTRISSWATMKVRVRGAYAAAVARMEQLRPDLVVSTHWATNYYAERLSPKPLTAVYVPDAHINALFRYPADLTAISMSTGYETALKKYRRRFDRDNLRLVPFAIREEAFAVDPDKKVNRRKLGLDENKFTVVLAEGGYGLGKMKEICKSVIALDLPVILIPLCGKNDELYRELNATVCGDRTEMYPQSFRPDVFEFMASADLFCGKSGNIIAEPTFFGVPSVITKHATGIEKRIGDYYVRKVGCAVDEFDPRKVARMIADFAADPGKLDGYRNNARANRGNYGAEHFADCLFELLRTRFPHL